MTATHSCFNSKRKGTVDFQMGRKGLCFYVKLDLQVLHTSEWVDGVPDKYVNLQSTRACVATSQTGAACQVTRVLYRTSPADWRPHTGFVQNPLQSANLHY